MPAGELPIHDIATFVAVAQNASFTKAAERLGTSKSNVGKAVQRLEVRLGTRLLQRTTRAVRLTEDGELYLEAARTALDGLNEAEIALSARRDEPVGRVRLDIPIGFGRMLLPVFALVREQYPKVTLELSLSDRQSDPVKDGWDIVIRAGELPAEGEMTVRKLCDIRLGLYASHDYVARHAPLTSIHDLTGHEAIIFRAGSGKTRPWTVTDGNRVFETAPPASVTTGDGRAFIELCHRQHGHRPDLRPRRSSARRSRRTAARTAASRRRRAADLCLDTGRPPDAAEDARRARPPRRILPAPDLAGPIVSSRETQHRFRLRL